LTCGRYTAETEKNLELFEALGASGLRAIAVAHGFLS